MSTMETTAAFLGAHFHGIADDERFELRTFHRSGERDGKPGPRQFFTDPHQAAAWAGELPAALDVYYGVNPRRKGGGGKKADVTRIRGAWADVDDKHFADGRAGALAALAAFALPPSAVIDSGGGLQALWYFGEPLAISGADDPRIVTFEDLLSRLYVHLGGLDSVQDIPRVLRLPGTINGKYDPPRPVTVLEHNPAALYTLADFEAPLPAAAPTPTPAPFPTRPPRADDTPPVEEVREMLRCIPPRGDYNDHWVRLLAAVHSAYPGPEGVAVCEEWSPGKPGEIAAKFKSFGRYQGARGQATIATLIYEARRHGYERPRATFTIGAAPPADTPGDELASRLADLEREVAALRRENAEQAVAIERCGAEHTRKDATIAALRAEVAALEACAAHTDQTVGGSALDITEAALAAYDRGKVLTIDGKDFARCPAKGAGRRRSDANFSRAVRTIGAARPGAVHFRRERIETDRFRGEVEIPYIHIPPEHRRGRGAAALYLLPSPPERKRHGGRKTIPVPPEVAAAGVPVRRSRQTTEKFHRLDADRNAPPLAIVVHPTVIDHWQADGTAMTAEEAAAFQVEIGVEPPPPPPWRPVQRPFQLDDRGPRTTGAQVETAPPTAADPDPFQLETASTAPAIQRNQGCRVPSCGSPPARGGYCDRHHPDRWGDLLQLRDHPTARAAAGD